MKTVALENDSCGPVEAVRRFGSVICRILARTLENPLSLADIKRVRPRSGGFWVLELDGLRAIACGLVLVAHFNPWMQYRDASALTPVKAIMGGNTGVMLFFSLSAFLLTSICLAEIDRHGRLDLKAFFLRRILRIWPLYFFILIVGMLIIWPSNTILQAPGASLLEEQWIWAKESVHWYAIFLGNWIDHKVSEIGMLWTICVEEQFYLVLPFVILVSMKLRRRAWIVLACIALTSISMALLPSVDNISVVYYHTTTYISTFAFGAAAAFLSRRSRVPAVLTTPAFLAVCIVGVVAVLAIDKDFWWEPNRLSSILLYQVVAALLVFIVWWVARNSGAPSLKFLRSSSIRSLGVLSYGIYMTHGFSHRFVNLETNLLGLSQADDVLIYHLVFVQYAALAVLLASLTHALVERPFLKLRKQLLPNSSSAIDTRWALDWQNVALVSAGSSLLAFIFLALLSPR